MPRMSKERHELSFYLNDRGRVTYNELCRKCSMGASRASGRCDYFPVIYQTSKEKEEHTE